MTLVKDVRPNVPASVRCLSDENRTILCGYRARGYDALHIELTPNGKQFVLTIGSEGWNMPCSPEMFPWHQTLPERKQTNLSSVDKQQWIVPAVDTVALSIMLAWDEYRISFGCDRAETKFRMLCMGIRAGDLVATLQAKYKESGFVPEHELTTNPDLPLKPYQHVELACMMGNPGYALFAKQGTGKTAPTIARICNEALEIHKCYNRMYRAIVVCPNGVRLNWQAEIARFATCPVRVTRIDGTDVNCVRQLSVAFHETGDAIATVCVIGYDKLATIREALKYIQWDLAVADEIHIGANPKTKRFKHLLIVRDHSDQRLALTGTPIKQTPVDLYGIFEFLEEGGSGFSSFKNFGKFYGKVKADAQGVEALKNFKNVPILQERIARKAFLITKEEALPFLPAKTYDMVEVEFTVEQAQVYRQMEEQITLEIERELDEAEGTTKASITANNALVKLLKLAQITAGHLEFPDMWDESGTLIQEKHTRIFTPNPKIDMVVEMLREKEPGEKTIIWSSFVAPIVALQSKLTKEGIVCVSYYGATSDADRAEAQRRFNEDDACTVIIANQKSAGMGNNWVGHPIGAESYHTRCNHEIFFAQGWSSPEREQAEDRAHRIGTYENVRITDLVIPDTIDQDIRERVTAKRDMAFTISDIRKLLRKLTCA